MKSALVVYESLFGDTRAVAQAIAEGLSGRMPAKAVDVDHAPVMIGPEVVLLVVGGPNHQLSMTRPGTRRQAEQDYEAEVISHGIGLREWFASLNVTVLGVPAVAFDTRLDHPRFFRRIDHASHTEETLLSRHGFALLAPAEHFFVTSATGPLVPGEEERARRWGQSLAEKADAWLAGAIG